VSFPFFDFIAPPCCVPTGRMARFLLESNR
jgi:hypothetical protein